MAVMKINYGSEALGRTVTINVILPIEDSMMFKEQAPKPEKFKTLYLLHGYYGNCDDWIYGTKILELAETLRLAVVMPSGENGFYIDGPSKHARYGTFAGKELVEFTRSLLPLSDKKEDTFIAGLSMGGYGALRLGSLYHETFGRIAIFSAGLRQAELQGISEDYEDDLGDYALYTRIFGDLNHLAGTDKDPVWCALQAIKAGGMPPLYMACGTEDSLLECNRRAAKTLREAGAEIAYYETPGSHSWDFWNDHIGPAIRWMLAD